MALSNWDMLAFDVDGPSHFGFVVNHANVALSLHQNWLEVTRMVRSTTGPRWRRRDSITEQHEGTIFEGHLRLGSWSICAQRGPQDGIYVIATSVDSEVRAAGKAFLVGCGVYGYSKPSCWYAERALELDVDPDTLMNAEDSIIGFRSRGDIFTPVTVAAGQLPEPRWVGVTPDSVVYLRHLVDEYIRDECAEGLIGWLGPALAAIPWDQAERCNQGDLFFEDALGAMAPTTAPGAADEPLLTQALGVRQDE
jgi:hypothetical protein